MTRYSLGIIAVVFAIVLASFTTRKPVDDMYVFQYDPTASGGYAKLDVENESNTNWKFIGRNEDPCSDNPTKACRVEVTATYVDNTTTPTALSGITITATESSSGIAYVSAITAPLVNSYSNKLQ